MADRKLSSRTRRRLRLNIARRLSGHLASTDTVTKRKCPAELEGRERCDPADKMAETSAMSLSEHLTSTDSATESKCPEFEEGSPGPCNETAETGSCLSEHSTPADATTHRECPELEGSRRDPAAESPSSSFLDAESFSDEKDLSSGSEFSEGSSELVSTLSDSLSEDSAPWFVPHAEEPGRQEKALFPGSSITAHDFDVSLMLFCQRHNLTYTCQNDLLRFMSVSFPTPNQVPRSSYMLLKQFVDFQHECTVHHFCGNCLQPLLRSSPCSNPECSVKSEPNAVFIHVPLTTQLKERLQGMCRISYYTDIV